MVCKFATVAVLGAAAVLAAPGTSPVVKVDATKVVPRTYLVRLEPEVKATDYANQVRADSDEVSMGRVIRSLNVVEVVVENDEALQALRNDPKVSKVYEVAKRFPEELNLSPDDKPEGTRPPYTSGDEAKYHASFPWGLDRINQVALPLDGNSNIEGPRGEGVDVYIVDTGLFAEHDEFEGRATAYFNANPNWPHKDDNSHGTHCAGTAVGKTMGVANKARVFGVKVMGQYPDGYYGTDADIFAGIEVVLNRPDKTRPAVASMSLGYAGVYELERELIAKLAADNVVTTVSAGNVASDSCTRTPAHVPTAITVGAVDWKDGAAWFSGWGPCVDAWAPGVFVRSAVPCVDMKTCDFKQTNVYDQKSGTSMSTPHVAGVAAVYRSMYPKATVNEVKRALVLNGKAPVNFTLTLPEGNATTAYRNIALVDYTDKCQSTTSNVPHSWCLNTKCDAAYTRGAVPECESTYAPKYEWTSKVKGISSEWCKTARAAYPTICEQNTVDNLPPAGMQ